MDVLNVGSGRCLQNSSVYFPTGADHMYLKSGKHVSCRGSGSGKHISYFRMRWQWGRFICIRRLGALYIKMLIQNPAGHAGSKQSIQGPTDET